MSDVITNTWQIRKPAVSTHEGLVATQHYIASNVGAEVLRNGGNAIDAAIAAGLALGIVEPWMSGIGGGGYMTVYLAATDEVKVVDFGMRAPFDATPDDYPLAGEGINSSASFNWPAVVGDTNIHGPLAAAVPGYIKGASLALSSFGTMRWEDVIEPACIQADKGLPIDWYSAQKVNQFARGLSLYDETRNTYLADGLPPVADADGYVKYLQLGQLASTYRQLQAEGPETFYTGALATDIAHDLKEAGSRITTRDLAEYSANITTPLSTQYRDAMLYVSGSLTAGPSIIRALGELEARLTPGEHPDTDAYVAYIESLYAAYEHRLNELGDGLNAKEPGNTTHVCVADKDGNVVSLTQTVMSAFGSRIMLPQSGILMNNGMMWFDPVPGGPNSVEGGRRPLCNMCPVILRGRDDSITAIGACGGRRIFPSVFQLTSFLTDFDMSVDETVHQPRIDVSGTPLITAMDHLPDAVINHLLENYPEVAVRPNGVNPMLFALPQIAKRELSGKISGGCFIPSPHALVATSD